LQRAKIFSENPDLTRSSFEDANQNIKKRTFSATATAEDYKGFFRKNLKADTIQHGPAIWKSLGDIDDFEYGRDRFRRRGQFVLSFGDCTGHIHTN
jgi:hypothetical protein